MAGRGKICGGLSGWKVQGNWIVRILKFHTPEVEFNCLGGCPERRAGEGGSGSLCFQNAGEARVWHVALSRSRRDTWERDDEDPNQD